jgi:hypothetical protein
MHSSYRALLNDIMQKYHLELEYQDTVHGPSQAHGELTTSRTYSLADQEGKFGAANGNSVVLVPSALVNQPHEPVQEKTQLSPPWKR